METWVPAFGYEGLYSVSSEGNIKSDDRIVRHYSGGPKRLSGAIIKTYVNMHGYRQLTLSKNNKKTKHRLHRLILQSFTRQSGEGLDSRHLDGDKTNNRINNLAWGTRADNMQDCVSHGRTTRGTKHVLSRLTENDVLAIRDDQRKQKFIASQYGIDQSTVSNIKTKKRWAHI